MCTVRSLLQAILQTEDMLKVYEARLTEEETVCLDLDKVEAYRCGLKVTGRVSQVRGPDPGLLGPQLSGFPGCISRFTGFRWPRVVDISRSL